MEFVYTYGDSRRLYLNATNRCTNRCSFCVRFRSNGLGGVMLWGDGEPDLEQLRAAVEARGGPDGFHEFVWCGFGEPTFRLDLLTAAAPWLRSGGARIRLNTNGHACIIHGRDVLPEISRSVDEVSVSLNAPNCSRYAELCQPEVGRGWEAMLDFLSRAPAHLKSVQASVVGFVLTDAEIEKCRALALSVGVARFRIR
jgi:TatD DNase family protein